MKPSLHRNLILLLCSFFVITSANAREKFLDIQTHKTENGIEFWLVEDHSIPVIALDFAFENAGSKNDPKEKQGLAKLASNTLDEGAGDLDSNAFQLELRRKSISISFSASRDTFGGSLKTRTSTKDRAVELLNLALTQPQFNETDIQRMKDANIARIRSALSDPEWINARLANDIIFEGHPYALNSGGTITTLQSLTADDLRSFTKNRLAKDALRIGIVGDITVEQAKALINKAFSGLPDTQNLDADVTDIDLQNKGRSFLYELDIPQTIVKGYLPALSRTDPDYYAFQVMNQILGAGGFGSRLTKEVREKRGLTYGIYTFLSQMEHINFLTLGSSTENKNAGEMIKITKAEFSKMAEMLVSDEELKNAVSYINGSLPLSLSSTSNISGLILGMQLDNLPVDYLDNRADKFNAITKEDIQTVAKKYLTPNDMTFIFVGKPEGLDNESITKRTDIPNAE